LLDVPNLYSNFVLETYKHITDMMKKTLVSTRKHSEVGLGSIQRYDEAGDE
jgi:hypothetical protein